MLKTLILLFNLFPSLHGHYPDSTVREHPPKFYHKIQFAGNSGLVSAGGGLDFPGKIFADISIGYLPKHVNGARVFTLSFKPSYEPAEFRIGKADAGLYLGVAFNYSIGKNIFGKMPDYYPLDYYWPNAFRLNPFAGARVGFNAARGKLYMFTELGTVDYKIWFALKNRHVRVYDIVNLALGVMFSPGK